MTLGDAIKEFRDEHKYTMEKFAGLAGLSKGYISMLEKNVNPRTGLPITPSLETFRAVAHAMNIDVNELIKSVDSNQPVIIKKDLPKIDCGDFVPFVRGRRLPIIGCISAGVPVLASENIEGYDYADVPGDEDYFFLRVKGDSMINAGIFNGDLVLVQYQQSAENGQIVVCLVNGDEATLKRFHRQNDMVILQPENMAYQPILVSCKDFESGYARIIGVAKEVKRKL